MNKKERRSSNLTSMLQFILMKRLGYAVVVVFFLKEFCHVQYFELFWPHTKFPFKLKET